MIHATSLRNYFENLKPPKNPNKKDNTMSENTPRDALLNKFREIIAEQGWQCRDMTEKLVDAAITESEYAKLKADAELLDWLSDPSQNIGNVHLPTECVEKNIHSLRDAIRCAIDKSKESA